MIKAVEAIVMFTLFVFVFLAGVSYSDVIKSRAGWLFENNEEESVLPDLVNGKGAIDEGSFHNHSNPNQ